MKCEIKRNIILVTILFMVILILFDKFRKRKVCITIIVKFVNGIDSSVLMFNFSDLSYE